MLRFYAATMGEKADTEPPIQKMDDVVEANAECYCGYPFISGDENGDCWCFSPKCINEDCEERAMAGTIHGWCEEHHRKWCESYFPPRIPDKSDEIRDTVSEDNRSR